MKFHKKELIAFIEHLSLFLLVEILFVFIIFRELPPLNLLSLTGVLHTSYWIVVLGAGLIRNRFQKVWKKFLATYFPIVYHVFIHLYIAYASIHELYDVNHHHDEYELFWIILGTVVAGIIIGFGENRLHRKNHCDDHHAVFHHQGHRIDPLEEERK